MKYFTKKVITGHTRSAYVLAISTVPLAVPFALAGIPRVGADGDGRRAQLARNLYTRPTDERVAILGPLDAASP